MIVASEPYLHNCFLLKRLKNELQTVRHFVSTLILLRTALKDADIGLQTPMPLGDLPK